MVNPGHASKGCATCKIRRVKCDGKTPACARCTKSKRLCLGYDGQHQGTRRTIDVGHRSSARFQSQRDNKDSTNTVALLSDTPGMQSSIHSQQRNLIDPLGQLGHASSSSRADIYALNVISEAFQALQQPAQSIVTRRQLHQKYQRATGELRTALSRSRESELPVRSICLFALYEMTVNASPADGTWQIHVDGLLATIRETVGSVENLSPSYKVMTAIYTQGSIDEYLSGTSLSQFEKACLILDLAKLRLRSETSTIDTLAKDIESLRQIDLVKLRVVVKQVYQALVMVPVLLNEEAKLEDSQVRTNPVLSAMRWNEFRTLRIISATLLSQIRQRLCPRKVSTEHSEPAKIRSEIVKAVDEICASAALWVPQYPTRNLSTIENLGVQTTDFSRMLPLVWPLYCGSRVTGIKESQRELMRDMLMRIGEVARLPIAFSLATPNEERNIFSDTLTGLLIVGIGVTEALAPR